MDDVTLTNLVCAHLARLPGWAYDIPTAADVAVSYGALAAEPHRGVGVRVYGIDDRAREYVRARRVQLRLRGGQDDPEGADKLAVPAEAVMLGLADVPGISTVSRLSISALGADKNRREERTDNYLITLDNQESLR